MRCNVLAIIIVHLTEEGVGYHGSCAVNTEASENAMLIDCSLLSCLAVSSGRNI